MADARSFQAVQNHCQAPSSDIHIFDQNMNSHAGFLDTILPCVDIRPIKLTAGVIPCLLLTSAYNPSTSHFKSLLEDQDSIKKFKIVNDVVPFADIL